MNATQTTTTAATLQTPTAAQAYFVGYAYGEARTAVGSPAATVREVVEAFSQAVAAGRVARTAFRTYAAGFSQAEKMTADLMT